MTNKFQSCFYMLDLVGTSPELYIFHNNRYKTIFSTILSIIIIFFSIFFTLYSLVEFFKYDSPIISYSKGNDKKTKREFFLKNSFLMFELIDSTTVENINNSTAYIKSDYRNIYENGSFEFGSLEIERCELGKNIDIKYKDFIKDKSNFGRPLEEFYCLGSNNNNISLFYYPDIGYNIIRLHIIFRNISEYIPEKVQTLIVSEINLIDHNNKNNPISNSFEYHPTQSFSSFQYTTIQYNFQYIKYDSDDGFFFKNSKILNGISFSDMNYFNALRDDYNLEKNLKENQSSTVGIIEFSINKSNYDSYQRSYQRLQSLLAEIMSVVSLLFEIGNQIANIFCEKNMKKDIVEHLIFKDKTSSESKKNFNVNKIITQNSELNLEQNRKRYESSFQINKIDKQEISKNENIKDEQSEKSNDNNNTFNENDKMKKVIENNKELKKINYFNILVSYLCFKDKKSEIINLCDDIVTEDLCVERILKRLYNLERFYSDLSLNEEKEETKVFKNKIFEPKKVKSKQNNYIT